MAARPALARLAAPTRALARPRPALRLPTGALPLPPAACSALSTSASSHASASTSAAAAPPTPAPAARVYPARKAFLYDYYTHLLSTSDLVLLFSHANLTVSDLARLRRAINAVPVPSPSPSSATPSDPASPASPPAPTPAKARLEVVRTGLLGPVTRAQPASLGAHLSGPAALLTCPSLSPAYLSGLLAAVARTLKQLKRADAPAVPGAAKGAKKGPKPARLDLVAAVLEGDRLVLAPAVEDVARLPEIDVLRAQLVGLLESGGRGLVGVLEHGRGGGLVRTLQGLEKSLEGGDVKAE